MPIELYQYLACGKNVVASEIENLPECEAVFTGKSTSEVIDNIRLILSGDLQEKNVEAARTVALEYDWKKVAKDMTEDKYNYSFTK